MRKGFLLKSSNDDNKKITESQQLKSHLNWRENLEFINQVIQLDFKPIANLRAIPPNINLNEADIQTSIYAIIPKEKELSYQAFCFIANSPNVDFYYHESSTIVLIKGLMANFNEELSEWLKYLLHIRGNCQLQQQAIMSTVLTLSNAEDEISKKTGSDFKQYVLSLTVQVLHLLQMATLLKLPNYFVEIGLEVMKSAIPDMLILAQLNNVDISDINKMSIKELYETLHYRLNESMGASNFISEGMFKNEGDWKELFMLSLDKHAEFIGWKCLDADCTFYNEPSLEVREKLFLEYLESAKNFLAIVHERFSILKNNCKFKASTYYLYRIFNLDILVNVILKNPLNPDSNLFTEERNILIYMDRYSKGGTCMDMNITLAHVAMTRIGLHRKDAHLVDHHFNQFKEIYIQAEPNQAGYLHSFMLVKVSEIIKQIGAYYESTQEFQKSFQAFTTLNLIANAAYKRLVQFQKSLRDYNLDEFIRANPNNPLARELMESRLTTIPYEFFESERNRINQFCSKKLSELLPKVQAQKARGEIQLLRPEDEAMEKVKEIGNISLQSEKLPIYEEKQITENFKQKKLPTASKAENKKTIQYSESHFLWSSLNKKLNLEARIDIQSCESLAKEELEAALRILKAARITGAIGDGIKLVTEEEQRQHNLQGYIYKIKHVGLNFRIYGKFYGINGRKELVFDYAIHGHKNHTKNTPENIKLKAKIS